MFYDLNVPYNPNDPDISNTLIFIAELGYTTVALSQSISGKLPPTLCPPSLPRDVPKSLTLLSRLNLTITDASQNQRLSSLTQSYSLIALRPTNEKAFSSACTSLDCDIISLDVSTRLPFHFKFKTLSAAVTRGVRFEICYGPGITGSGVEARRNLIGNSTALIRATRGRGIIISSEARRALALRAPWDVINLACVWGLSQEKGKEALCEEARKVIALARMKRASWRGVVEVVYGGEKQDIGTKESKGKNKDKEKEKERDKEKNKTKDDSVQHGANGTKRKASTDPDAPAEIKKPLSKRELKRRAKKARFEGLDAEAPDSANNGTVS